MKHVFRHMPNLTNLTILFGVIDYIDAGQIQETIESYLPLLQDFKFKIHSYESYQIRRIRISYNAFQTNFWHQQHSWFTDWDSSCIYTRSYPLDTHTSLYDCNKVSTNQDHAFDKIQCLSVDPNYLLGEPQFFSAKISQLKLETGNKGQQKITNMNVQQLRARIDFNYIRCLHIDTKFVFEYSSDLFELLKNQSNLRELTIPQTLFASFIQYCELYEDFQVRIRILNLIYDNSTDFIVFDYVEILPRFQYVFTNLETFTGRIRSIENIIYLINHFTKLSTMDIVLNSNQNPENELNQLNILLSERNAIHDIKTYPSYKDDNNYHTKIFIWI